jgi:serine/threonine protein kinase
MHRALKCVVVLVHVFCTGGQKPDNSPEPESEETKLERSHSVLGFMRNAHAGLREAASFGLSAAAKASEVFVRTPPAGDGGPPPSAAASLSGGGGGGVRSVEWERLRLDERPIGRGQEKTVYSATLDGAPVALLVAKPGESLEREAAIFQAAGEHPRLIHFFGISSMPAATEGGVGSQCLVTTLARHGSLDQVLDRSNQDGQPLPLGVKLAVTQQICDGMAYLHARNLIHRDLATRNVLVKACGAQEGLDGAGWEICLTDYGLTKDVASDGAYYGPKSSSELPVLWMAPEALQRRRFSPKSDVWAFGVT